MIEEVFLCENNISKGLEPVIKKLEERYPMVSFFIEPCLGQCSLCDKQFYAVIRAENIIAESPEQLYNRIDVKLEELLNEGF
ncbi:DUF1450 domain-containing protein [Vallitalea okinawensis]|uniref:DUF1450 domain-containing protein n=1 Tax=Vallitalea okinawensis TaxID=2078660 RepID=UPI000CFCCCEB|nr:DUF1450 domain-containing protein [Vallitalea okinawensis]